MGFGLPPDPDDALFVLLQSMGYGPNIPLWRYQQHKRELERELKPFHEIEPSPGDIDQRPKGDEQP